MFKIARKLFEISEEEATFAKRGFHTENKEIQEHLETAAKFFLRGYHAALDNKGDDLKNTLESFPNEYRGFAYEGAGMGQLITEVNPFGKGSLETFIDNQGNNHEYMLIIGAGWVLGRIPLNIDKLLNRFDQVLCYLTFDGYGFHEGFFHPKETIQEKKQPSRLSGYALNVFDQGIGRSMWFVFGGEVHRIAEAINSFPIERQPDFWSGVGLAATYAGKVDEETLLLLKKLSGEYFLHLAQGVSFAAKARERAGNIIDYTNTAVYTLLGLSIRETSEIVEKALYTLSPSKTERERNGEVLYSTWRRLIREGFAEKGVI